MGLINFLNNIFRNNKDINQQQSQPNVVETTVNPIEMVSEERLRKTLNIPNRSDNSLSGTDFCNRYSGLYLNQRDVQIFAEISAGNIPEFLRTFCEVSITYKNNNIVIYVLPDYMCIGSDEDYVRMPMSAKTGQRLASIFDCMLPTKRMVDIIWKNAPNKINQSPMGPPYDATMQSMQRLRDHNSKIELEMQNKDKSLLTAGHKKDIILDNALAPNNPNKRISIYGWQGTSGISIQGPKPQSSAHAENYQDYSQCIRLVSNTCKLNGNMVNINQILDDKDLSYALNEDGVLRFKKY